MWGLLLLGLAAVIGLSALLLRRPSSVSLPAKASSSPSAAAAGTHVAVLVLGDLGRSPRMSYHALSLANNGFQVSLIGYRGAQPMQTVLQHPRIRLRYISEPVRWAAPRSRLHFIATAPFKVLLQLASLLWVLLGHVNLPVHFLLVQNPPSIPTLAIARFLVLWWRCRLVIDWHNTGYSLLALRVGRQDHWLVRVAKAYERILGRNAFAHLSVTRAMADFLTDSWHLSSRPLVLHDKAPDTFRRLSLRETHTFLKEVQGTLGLDNASPEQTLLTVTVAQAEHDDVLLRTTSTGSFASGSSNDDEWARAGAHLFTGPSDATHDRTQLPVVRVRPHRPALLVSGTSWTEDEDFGLLLTALKQYAAHASEHPQKRLAPLVVVVTGRGPMREHYERQFPALESHHVRVRTAWLRAEDYPRLLGCADLGISLHTSSSGLDLPMKVVDMFGCGLPVCAARFQCVHELVRHLDNGLVFASADELAKQLISIFTHWAPENGLPVELQALADGVKAFQQERWEHHWDKHALPLFACK